MTEGYTSTTTVPSTSRGPLSPAGSAYPTIDGNTASSDDSEEFLEAAEGEKDYVDEWDGGNIDVRGDEKEGDHSSPSDASGEESQGTADYSFEYQSGGIPAHDLLPLGHYPNLQGSPEYSTSQSDEDEEESLTGEHDTGGDDSDMEMAEDHSAESDVEEENTNGYEADHSESGTSQSPDQSQQPSPYQGVAVSSPSNLSTVSTASLTANARIGQPNPPANQSVSSETSNVSDLDSEEFDGSGDVAEAPAIQGLLNALSDLALVPPAGEHPNPSLPAGSITTSTQHTQDSPNTSAESDTLLEMMQQRFDRTVGVEYSRVMAPASNGGMGFLEDEQK
ncbi:hypothetical protein FRC00_007496 [Tulasnella sp. 408]|nr:hypothetical protein FRC00_007496 [Tulasnella sp. 408]